MDRGRHHDINDLQEAINDPNTPRAAKEKAQEIRDKILSRRDDSHLSYLRSQLLYAREQHDLTRADMLSDEIKMYQESKYGE